MHFCAIRGKIILFTIKKGRFTTRISDAGKSFRYNRQTYQTSKEVMKMHIAICDDEVSMGQILEEKIKEIYPDAAIVQYLSGDELLASGCSPDLLFLDIQMPGTDGMETARLIRQKNEDMNNKNVIGQSGILVVSNPIDRMDAIMREYYKSSGSKEKLYEQVIESILNDSSLSAMQIEQLQLAAQAGAPGNEVLKMAKGKKRLIDVSIN